jgi:hypothetical protein
MLTVEDTNLIAWRDSSRTPNGQRRSNWGPR